MIPSRAGGVSDHLVQVRLALCVTLCPWPQHRSLCACSPRPCLCALEGSLQGLPRFWNVHLATGRRLLQPARPSVWREVCEACGWAAVGRWRRPRSETELMWPRSLDCSLLDLLTQSFRTPALDHLVYVVFFPKTKTAVVFSDCESPVQPFPGGDRVLAPGTLPGAPSLRPSSLLSLGGVRDGPGRRVPGRVQEL